MTRDEFFNQLATGAKWDIAVSIHRTNPVPIDVTSVFKNEEEALSYARTNPTAHYGQIIVVVEEILENSKAYLIVGLGPEAQLKELGAGGGVTITVDTAMSLDSENPVQNKVITKAINDKQDTLTAGSGIKIDHQSNEISAGGVLVSSQTDLTPEQIRDLQNSKYLLWFDVQK